MRILGPLTLFIPAMPSFAAVVLAATTAYGQEPNSDNRNNNCKLLKATRGGSAEIVPEEEFNPNRAREFRYLIDDSHLDEDFRVDKEKRSGCMVVFGIQNAAASAAGAAGAAAAAAAPGAAAAVGAGIGAGFGTITAGAAVIGGLSVIAGAAAIGVITGGGNSGQPTSTTCTTCVGASQ